MVEEMFGKFLMIQNVKIEFQTYIMMTKTLIYVPDARQVCVKSYRPLPNIASPRRRHIFINRLGQLFEDVTRRPRRRVRRDPPANRSQHAIPIHP